MDPRAKPEDDGIWGRSAKKRSTDPYSVSVFNGNAKVASAARRAPVQARCAAPKLPRTKKS